MRSLHLFSTSKQGQTGHILCRAWEQYTHRDVGAYAQAAVATLKACKSCLCGGRQSTLKPFRNSSGVSQRSRCGCTTRSGNSLAQQGRGGDHKTGQWLSKQGT